MNKKAYISFLLLFCASIQINAQQNTTMFFMQDMPQVNIVNPAVAIKCNWYVGLPLLGSTHVNQFSSGFATTDILQPGDGNELFIMPDEAISKMNNLEVLAAELHVNLLSFGYKYKQHYFTFTVNEKMYTYNIYPKNLLLLAKDGNSQFEGKNVEMDGLRINGNHYREYALGWAKKVNKDFDFGIRGKLLFGKSNAYMKPATTNIYTQANTFALDFTNSATGNISAPITITEDDDGKVKDINLDDNIDWMNYALNRENIGVGIDLGFVYKIDELTTISGSLLDIGFINWKTNPYNLVSNGNIALDGIGDDFNDQDNNEALDSIAEFFKPEVLQNGYKSKLTPILYLGVSREINKKINVGVLYHTEIYINRLHSSLTFSANAKLLRNLSTSASYSLQNNTYNNLGLGIGWQLGLFHLHAISDNVPAFFALDAARNINLRFGISFIGCPRNAKSKNGAYSCPGDPYNAIHYSSPRKKNRKHK